MGRDRDSGVKYGWEVGFENPYCGPYVNECPFLVDSTKYSCNTTNACKRPQNKFASLIKV